jgi:hypothetical protein
MFRINGQPFFQQGCHLKTSFARKTCTKRGFETGLFLATLARAVSARENECSRKPLQQLESLRSGLDLSFSYSSPAFL